MFPYCKRCGLRRSAFVDTFAPWILDVLMLSLLMLSFLNDLPTHGSFCLLVCSVGFLQICCLFG